MFKKLCGTAALALALFTMGCASGGSKTWGNDNGSTFPAQQVCNATG
ncbi:MAG: hypothetical protein JWN13_6544 [Betaproteobacteria bacterium]|jgi:hypothetical protein|nr:hypothetical protein [Betaproteobacteria bacterium]